MFSERLCSYKSTPADGSKLHLHRPYSILHGMHIVSISFHSACFSTTECYDQLYLSLYISSKAHCCLDKPRQSSRLHARSDRTSRYAYTLSRGIKPGKQPFRLASEKNFNNLCNFQDKPFLRLLSKPMHAAGSGPKKKRWPYIDRL